MTTELNASEKLVPSKLAISVKILITERRSQKLAATVANLRIRIASGRSFASLSLIKNQIAISRPIRVTEAKT